MAILVEAYESCRQNAAIVFITVFATLSNGKQRPPRRKIELDSHEEIATLLDNCEESMSEEQNRTSCDTQKD